MNRARGYYSYSTHFTRVVWPARARPPTPVRARPQRYKAYNKNRLYKHESCETMNDSQQPTPTTPNTPNTHIPHSTFKDTQTLRTTHYACPHPSTLILLFILLISIGATLALAIREEVPPGPYGISMLGMQARLLKAACAPWCKPSDWDLNLDPKRAWPRKHLLHARLMVQMGRTLLENDEMKREQLSLSAQVQVSIFSSLGWGGPLLM